MDLLELLAEKKAEKVFLLPALQTRNEWSVGISVKVDAGLADAQAASILFN